MKLGSLFDGSGGFPLAGAINGVTPVWAAEVEPYPIAVTRSRFPNMKHYGNVCDINGAEVEPVDIITAGSPCQDLSVAGLRAGIYEGKRSNLFFESIRIVKEMRKATNGKYPRFFVWENVPGAFSSDKGGAFQAVLQEICSVKDDTVSIPKPPNGKWLKAGAVVGNGYSIAWRTLDAQYWGVPQRRARIYLVADFDAECAAEILFKPESVRGHLQSSDEAREEAAADAVGSVDGSNGTGCIAWTYRGREGGCNVEYQDELAYALRDPVGGGSIANICYKAVIYEPASLLEENWQESEVKNALRANASKSSHAIVQAAAFMGGQGAKARSIAYTEDVTPTLKSAPSGGNTVPDVVIAFSQNQRDEVRDLGDKAGALAAEAGAHQQTYVCQEARAIATQLCGDRSNPNVSFSEELAYCLPANPMSDRGQVIALQANGIDRADNAGCNGCGWRENECYTLNTIDRHAVCYSFDSLASNSMKSKNPISGCREVDVAKCLDTFDPNPSKNQDGIAVVEKCYTADCRNNVLNEELSATLQAHPGGGFFLNCVNPCVYPNVTGTICGSGARTSRPAGQCNEADLCVVQDTYQTKTGPLMANSHPGSYTGQDAFSDMLVAGKSPKPPRRYIIRRLMPVECARLQGFPDAHGELAPYDGDDAFWEGVRKTHAEINGKKYKPTKNIKGWYEKLHNDGAEYKCWGNGIALPCAEFVLHRIVERMSE